MERKTWIRHALCVGLIIIWVVLFLATPGENKHHAFAASALQDLIIAIPHEKTKAGLYSIYPISILTNGKYAQNETGSHYDTQEAVWEKNRQAIDIANRKKKFMVFSDAKQIGTFTTTEINYIQGRSCEYIFSPVGKLQINNGKSIKKNIKLIISQNDGTKTCDIEANTGSVSKSKLLAAISSHLKSFDLKISNISFEYDKRIKVSQNTDLILTLTHTTLSQPHSFYESAGKTSSFESLSIFQSKDGILTPLYQKNPDHVIYTEFIWAGDIEGDGKVEVILREAYGEFGKFVIFRYQQDRLIKIFEGTEYGC